MSPRSAKGTYRKVLTGFWTDPDVRRLTPLQSHLLLYLCTNRHTNLCGLYYLPLEYVVQETRLAADDVEQWIRVDLRSFVTYDAETEEILVHRLAYHDIGGKLLPKDNRVRTLERLLADAHSDHLVAQWHELYADWPIEPPKPLPKPRADAQKEGASKGLHPAPAVRGSNGPRSESPNSPTDAENEAPSKPLVRKGSILDTGSPPPSPTEPNPTYPPPDRSREDGEALEVGVREALPLARANIVSIHGGVADVVIEVDGKNYPVGMGLEIEAFKRLCRAGHEPPDIIARAIAFLPEVTGLEPPITLARWGAEKDGPSVYEQCVGRAYHANAPTDDVATVKRIPAHDRDAKTEARKAELRAQVEQLRGADA